MFSWECTLEEELEIKKEEAFEEGFETGFETAFETAFVEGFMEVAKKLLNKGMLFQDVAYLLDLNDSQIEELKSWRVSNVVNASRHFKAFKYARNSVI